MGRAQVLLPRHLEQTLNAKQLGAQGAAVRMGTPFEVKHATAAVQHATGSEAMHRKVRGTAQAIANRPGGKVIDRIVAEAIELAAT